MIKTNDLTQLIGETICKRYKLLKILGEGGMGVVFEATDEEEKRTVAIKLLFTEIASDEVAKKRFFREAKMGMALVHPNIVRTYNYGEVDENIIFISMEYVKGESLSEYIKKDAPLRPKDSLSIVKQLCESLEYAHQKQVLHRDLKPANVLLSKNESGEIQVKLADFGIAKLLAPNEDITSGTNLTETGVVLGTINYIAPEYLLCVDLSRASDVYSLGVIIYQLLTDRYPVVGITKEQLLYNKVYKDIVPPSKAYKFFPQALDKVLMKVLNRNPMERYQSALDFWEDFKQVVESLQ